MMRQILVILLLVFLSCTPTRKIESIQAGLKANQKGVETYVNVTFGPCSFNDSAQYNDFGCFLSDYKRVSYFIDAPIPGLTIAETDSAIIAAAQILNGIIDLPFYRVDLFSNPTLNFSAYRLNGKPPFHSFDGPSGTLAHTYWWCYYRCDMGGNVFFDEDGLFATENNEELPWAVKVVLHEILHFLGFQHNTEDPNSILAPFYKSGPIVFTPDDSLALLDNYTPKILTHEKVDSISAAPSCIFGRKRSKRVQD